MNLGILILLTIIFIIFFTSYLQKKKVQKKKTSKCFLDKLFLPFSSIYELWSPNNTIMVDYINENSLTINTPYKNLYVLEVKDFKELDEKLIFTLYKKFKHVEDGFFYQAIIKNNSYQKQYLFSYSKPLTNLISNNINVKILSGKKAIKVLKRVVFADDNKNKLNINDAIKNSKSDLCSQFEILQGYKAKEGHLEDTYNKLKETHFKGVIWGYYDFFQGRIKGYISYKLKNNHFFISPKELVIINFILISENITKEQINQISNIYNISLVKKSINDSEIILKTPLKHRDVQWDLLVNLDYLSNQFIAKGK